MKNNKIIIKNSRQIDGIRRSCKVAAEALRFIAPYVVEGVTTNYLNDKLAQFAKERKAIMAPLNYKGFPKETCISLNEVVCHGIPSEIALKKGDILNVDVTTIVDGYYGDTSSMFVVGEVSKEVSDLLEVTKQCLDIGIKQVKPNNKIGCIGHAISEFAESRGFSVVTQFCGHGTGVFFHEPPNIIHKSRKDEGATMEENMIFTIEPMINQGVPDVTVESDGWTVLTLDKKLSAQYEHTVLVTKDGVEILTL